MIFIDTYINYSSCLESFKSSTWSYQKQVHTERKCESYSDLLFYKLFNSNSHIPCPKTLYLINLLFSCSTIKSTHQLLNKFAIVKVIFKHVICPCWPFLRDHQSSGFKSAYVIMVIKIVWRLRKLFVGGLFKEGLKDWRTNICDRLLQHF